MSSGENKLSRYSRHELLPEVGPIGQAKIRASKVLCIGAGGLGSPVISYLAAAGIGTLGIIDYDRVDRTNLQRQIIHNESSLGELKAYSAERFVKEINSDVEVHVHAIRLTEKNALEIIREYDLVLDGSDNFSTRYLVNDACVILGKPLVWGSVLRFDGQVSIFDSKNGPCYRCIFPKAPAPETVPNCSIAGVLGSVCGTVGTMMATEAIKYISGSGTQLIGKILLYSALDSTFEKLNVIKKSDCIACSPSKVMKDLLPNYAQSCSEVPGVSTLELESLIQNVQPPVILDVRTEEEFAKERISGAINIPSAQFAESFAQSGFTTQDRFIVYCQQGIRSIRCVSEMNKLGYWDVQSLEGGFTSWQLQH